jgi:hypothetical protein
LSRLFRKKFLRAMGTAFRNGKLHFSGELRNLADPSAFRALCRQAARIEWVVYAKPPFGGPQRVLKYLARYTHRVAISNHRLRALENDSVSFDWKDYAHRHRTSTMSMDAVEFLRRFLLHVFPSGLVRIRQFGFLANRVRKQKLELCRALLQTQPAPSAQDSSAAITDPHLCPVCKLGRLLLVEVLDAEAIAVQDTS